MTGQIKTLVVTKHYGFIRSNGKEFFFHHDDFLDNWDEMVKNYQDRKVVNVEFEEAKASGKGPRASKVRIIN